MDIIFGIFVAIVVVIVWLFTLPYKKETRRKLKRKEHKL